MISTYFLIVVFATAFSSEAFLLTADTSDVKYDDEGVKVANISDEEIFNLTNFLFNNDPNNIGVCLHVNLQGRVSSDKSDQAEENLLVLKDGVNLPKSIEILDEIHQNYQFIRKENESMTDGQRKAILKFHQVVTNSSLVKEVATFLVKKDIFQSVDAFKKDFFRIWFELYRNPTRKTDLKMISGFEHVFLGEIDYTTIGGFHNWYRFYKQEQERTMNYLGHYRVLHLGRNSSIVTNQFSWYGHVKFISSLWTGTSPEFEMAIYTLCVYTRPQGRCKVRINGNNFNIVNYQLRYQNQNHIATTYPDHPVK